MLRLSFFVILFALSPLAARAVTFNFLTHADLIGRGAGPDLTWGTADDEDWSSLGMNPDGAITYYEFNDPAEFGLGSPDAAVIGYSTGSFTISSAAGDQVIYGANNFTSLTSDFTYNLISDRVSQTPIATNLPGQNELRPGLNQWNLLAPPFQLYTSVSSFGDPGGGPGFLATALGSYMLAGQDPALVFSGLFDPATEMFLIAAWNFLLPLLPTGWTLAGAEFQDFALDGLPGILDGRLTTAFYSTEQAAIPIEFNQGTDVPEPGTFALAACALGTVALRRRMRGSLDTRAAARERPTDP